METRLSVYVFNAVQRDCIGKWVLHKGIMGCHNIMFITRGTIDFYFNGRLRRVGAGDVTYYAKGTEREAKNPSPDAQLYAFDFDLFGCDKLPLPEVSHFNDYNAFMPNFKSFFFSWYQKYDGYDLRCSGIFSMILSSLIYPNAQREENVHVNAMKEYIVEHFNEPVTVDMLASIVNLSPAYCGALFIRTEGTTIHEFVNKMRITKAKELLVSDWLSIAEISTMIGYNDVFYFSKKFKSLTGTSPSEYRRSHQI